MPSDLDFPLAPVYERIVRQLYDYETLAGVIADEVGSSASALELCVGTGGLALQVMRHGLSVTGLDGSRAMLRRAEQASSEVAGGDPEVRGAGMTLIHADAVSFSLQRVFDLIYVHSGHVLLNAGEAGLLVNGMTRARLRTALETAAAHLRVGGRLMLSIERWEPEGAWQRTGDLDAAAGFWRAEPDGSWYRRFVIEENARFGTRMHVFFDSADGRLYVEKVERQPKLSERTLLEVLEDVGFLRPRRVEVDTRSTPGFLVATWPGVDQSQSSLR